MTPELIILSVAIILIGVGVIAYVLLHGPKNAAHIGDTPEISLGDIPEGTPDPEEAGAPTEEKSSEQGSAEESVEEKTEE